MKRAVFFDRDGVLNRDVDYLHRPEELHWMPGAREAVRWCNDHGYLAIVVTNQSGVARGYFDEAAVQALHQWMQGELARAGAHIDAFYYCPHHPGHGVEPYRVECDCRKPKPGMVTAALAEWGIDPAASLLIGDKPRDIAAGEAAGVRSVLYSDGDLLAFLTHSLGAEAPEFNADKHGSEED